MKLPLLLSTAITLTASAKSEPQLRGQGDLSNFKNAPAVIFEGSDPFTEGLEDGREAANDLWDDMGDDCANAWTFDEAAEEEAEKRGWDEEGNNWEERAYNEGARAGMNEVVEEKEKECLHDSPEQCIELGETAATMIAYEYCGSGSGYSAGNYKKECRDVAIDQCKGAVYGKTSDMCGAPDTSTLNDLQQQCRKTVDQLLGIGLIAAKK